MEMHQIRYFLAVARTLNFTRAAEECNVAQPSLTRAIKNLEAELGGELFRRERVSSHLTNLGRLMLPMLSNCYDSAAAAKSQAESLKAGEHPTVRITLSQTIDLDLVAGVLGELERAFVDIHLSCQRASADDIVDQLRSGDSELAVAGPIDSSWDRIESWPLFAETHQVVVKKDHALATRSSIGPGDLAGERVIIRPYCEQWKDSSALYEADGIDIRQCSEVASDRDAIRLIEAGMGVGLLPASARVGDEMCKIPLANQVERTIRIYAVAGRQRSTALSGLMNLLRSADWTRFAGLATAG